MALVCADGEHALFSMPTRQTKAINVYRLDITGGKTTLLTDGKFDQNPVCSPDNKFFVYTKLVNGKMSLMRMSLEGGEPKQLSDNIVEFGAVSPDGKQIAMLTVQGEGVQTRPVIKVIPADGGAPIRTVDPHRGAFVARCESCHNTDVWKQFRTSNGFDHATTKFPLDGKHREVACMKCHKDAN